MNSSVRSKWSESALRLMRKLDNFNEPGSTKASCVPFMVCDKNVGILQPELVKRLQNYPEVFTLVLEKDKVRQVNLNPVLGTYESRTQAVLDVVKDLKEKDASETLRYWRNEDYDVSPGPRQPGYFKIERAATSLFGVRSYGTHMNGYIRHPDKGICLWLARRSPTKETFPNMLDNLAAGGLAVGYGIRETMIKECYEEASIPEDIAKNIVSVGCTSYIYESSRGISHEMQYVFDLELPLSFIPKPLDGEVQEFMLCDIEEVKQLVLQDDFKPNCAAITLQFLIRHGFVTPDDELNYEEIVARMNSWF